MFLPQKGSNRLQPAAADTLDNSITTGYHHAPTSNRQRRYVTAHEERVRQSFFRQTFMSTLGAELTTVVHGAVEIRLPFSPGLTQQNGYLHAGAVTAVLDSACGYAALTMTADDRDVLSVEFKVNLLAPATGEALMARAQVKKAGRTLIVCTADAFAISGGKEKMVATMLATIIAVPMVPAK
jgi:uncharacterized protein (TIGR00369 family)